MRRFVSWTVLLVCGLAACSLRWRTASNAPARKLTVFAAASLSQAFEEIGNSFEAENPGVTITFNFAGSQSLRTQIEQGAQADIMASADSAEMNALIAGGYVEPAVAQDFLTNKLVVILPAANPAGLQRLQDLARPHIKLVLAAEDVPVGKYARQALEQMNAAFGGVFQGQVLANVVSNEDNVKQVVAKVGLGEADAGIVYTSDAVAAPDLKTIDIPPDLNVTARYVIAPLADSHNAALAAEFVRYVRSPSAQRILTKWGFVPAQ